MNQLIKVTCLTFFLTPAAITADKDDGKPAQVTTVDSYLKDWSSLTTLQRERTEAKLKDKMYSGTIQVWDVKESRGIDEARIIQVLVASHGCYLRFDVRDPKLMKAAADLKKGSEIKITARLMSFENSETRGVFSGRTRVAVFSDVKSLDLIPNRQ